MTTVTFYFDFISPYVWLASSELPEVKKRSGAAFRFVPVLLAGLLKTHGTRGPAEVPAKHRYVVQDVMRLAANRGWDYQGPPAHPFNPLKSLRMCVALTDDAARERFATSLLEAAWGWGMDITDDATLVKIANDLGLPGEWLLTEASSDPVKAKLLQNTQGAAALGVFGVPSFVVEGEIFWGCDRFDLLENFLAGRFRVDPDRLENVLARPRTVDRPKA